MTRRDEIRTLRAGAEAGDVEAYYGLALAYYENGQISQARDCAVSARRVAAPDGFADSAHPIHDELEDWPLLDTDADGGSPPWGTAVT